MGGPEKNWNQGFLRAIWIHRCKTLAPYEYVCYLWPPRSRKNTEYLGQTYTMWGDNRMGRLPSGSPVCLLWPKDLEMLWLPLGGPPLLMVHQTWASTSPQQKRQEYSYVVPSFTQRSNQRCRCQEKKHSWGHRRRQLWVHTKDFLELKRTSKHDFQINKNKSNR